MKLFIAVFVLSLICSLKAAAKPEESASIETEAKGLPQTVHEFLDKELESLPPEEKHFRLGQQYHAEGKIKEAISELQLAIKEDPSHVASNCELGIIYMGKEDYGRAIRQLEKTLELDPLYPKTHYALANAYARKPVPDIGLARKYLDSAVGLGYNAVPWFLDYLKKLELQEKTSSDSPG